MWKFLTEPLLIFYRSALNDENKQGSEGNNSLQTVLLRGCEDSRKENGSAQGFNLGDENDNSAYFKDRKNLSCLHLLAVYLVMHCIFG